MTNNKILYVSSYGDEQGKQRGIVQISVHEDQHIDTLLYPIEGKVNCCIAHGTYMYVPVKEADANYLYIYELLQETLVLQRKIKTKYFYSYGFTSDDCNLYLASYEQGVDACLNMLSGKERTHVLEQPNKHGKSHFIGPTPDQKYIFAIDNGLQNINIYDEQLRVKTVVAFDENDKIRLMSYSAYSNRFYMSTEQSNVVYVLAYKDASFSIEHKINLLTDEKRCFSGGNAISTDGKFLCISIRGSNELQCYAIAQDGSLSLYDKVACGDMPRDAKFIGDTLCISCTNDNTVEFYEIKEKLVKVNEIHVNSPITFSI